MKQSENKWILILGILGALAVAFGAFGAHALNGKVPESSLEVYKTAVLYHFIHILAATIAFIFYRHSGNKLVGLSLKLFIVGILLFSGSLYLLSTASLTNLGSFSKILGPITPLGGLTFMTAWILMGIGVYKQNVA